MKKNLITTPENVIVRETAAEYAGGKEDISCAIIEHIGTLRTSASGWSREFNVVAWNGGKPRFDIRDWSQDHAKMSKGITMSDNELKRIFDWISARGTQIGEPAEEPAESF